MTFPSRWTVGPGLESRWSALPHQHTLSHVRFIEGKTEAQSGSCRSHRPSPCSAWGPDRVRVLVTPPPEEVLLSTCPLHG